MRALIALDGSASAEAVLQAIAPWLQASKASAELMTVIDASEIHGTSARETVPMPHTPPPIGGPSGLDVREEAPTSQVVENRGQAIVGVEDAVGDRLRLLAREHLAGIDCGIHVAAAEDTAGAIVEWAVHSHVDAIAMGTHGRSGLARALLGSVAEQVVRDSPVPVFLIRTRHP